MHKSACVGKPETECIPPECVFVKSSKRNYCRTKHNKGKTLPVLADNSLDVAKEMTGINDAFSKLQITSKHASPNVLANEVLANEVLANEVLANEVPANEVPEPENLAQPKSTTKRKSSSRRTTKTSSEVAKFRETYRRTRATRKISQFVRNNRSKIRAHFLKAICSDSGVCIAFGKETGVIHKHFDHFDNFKLLSGNATRIGAVSSNGFVNELTYEREGYKANAILKSSANSDADNLLYEALVGFYINSRTPFLPSFLETYGLYEYKADGTAYAKCKRHKSISPDLLQTGLTKIASTKNNIANEAIVRKSCKSPKSMAVLIQHLHNADTIRNKCNDLAFVNNDLFFVLYQVYMSLSYLANVFTHYDLHNENVLLYEPVKGSHIEYHYHFPKGEQVFRCKYIAKIIDYGRCFFNDISDTSVVGNSRQFCHLLCDACKPDCGDNSGFTWLWPNQENPASSYFINSQAPNQSHDLRLLNMLSKTVDMPFLKKTVYGKGMSEKKAGYGTEPNMTSGLPDKFNNVNDAFKYIHSMTNHPEIIKSNESSYQNSIKLGELHIYADKKTPMRYIPVAN